MAMSIISGVSSLSIDGVLLPVAEDLVRFEMATINREPVVSKTGAIFLKETPQAAKLSFSILVPSNIDVSSYNSLRSSNVVVQLANGATLNANSFATSGANEYDSNEGKLSLEFFGARINVSLGN
jgi:hypothetical protein